RNSILHVHGYKSAFYGWLARRGGATPIVATLHGPISISMRLRLYARIETWLLRRFDRVCVVSAPMRDDLVEAGVSYRRISLVENGIDTGRFRPEVTPMSRAGQGIPEDAFVFGAAMRLSEEKNPLGLLEAFAEVAARSASCWLTIAGEGPCAMPCRRAPSGLESARASGCWERATIWSTSIRCSTVSYCLHTMKACLWPCSRRWPPHGRSSARMWGRCPPFSRDCLPPWCPFPMFPLWHRQCKTVWISAVASGRISGCVSANAILRTEWRTPTRTYTAIYGGTMATLLPERRPTRAVAARARRPQSAPAAHSAPATRHNW